MTWALHKVQSVRDKFDPGGRIDISLVGGSHQIDSRALDFVRRFDFVTSVNMRPFEIHADGYHYHPTGCYNYIQDGWWEFEHERYCVLIPNAALERGIRLEQWLPQYAIDWSIFDHFRLTDDERAYGLKLRDTLRRYAVFYPGPLHGNTEDGHNRNALWTPQEWVELGRRVRAMGLEVVTVGAPYDRSYYELLLKPALNGDAPWYNLIGATNIGQLYSVTSNAQFVVSYQAGVGIVSALMGTPTAIWWRPQGDSISPTVYLSFDERMNRCWASPKMLESGSYFPMVYGKHGVESIMEWVKEHIC